jgi:hypothetical protein
MRETRIDIRELLAGAFTIALGAAAVWIAQDYPFGQLRRMGPGYFPTSLGWLLVALGAAIFAGGFLRPGLQPRPWSASPLPRIASRACAARSSSPSA